MINADMHIHTKYSHDCTTNLDRFRKICLKRSIFPVITDHNTIAGALKYRKLYKDCIIGEEISTKQGEIIGLFLEEEIAEGLDITEVIDKIRQQDGLVFLQHPFDKLRKNRLKEYYFDKMKFDIVEIFNSRTLFHKYDLKAKNFAEKNKLLKGVGSDAHLEMEIGASYVMIDEFNSKKQFLKNLESAKFFVSKSPFYVHMFTKCIKLKRLV
ncbi:PHP domain-containing protein [Candidatus Woesearchaeota archaeon]|nr:PHP domain-containing protein [Candidatus Woesearchaeota archaeon]